MNFKKAEKWTLKNKFFDNFQEAAKLCKASDDTCNCGGLVILQDLINERIAEGVAFNPHDFTQ